MARYVVQLKARRRPVVTVEAKNTADAIRQAIEYARDFRIDPVWENLLAFQTEDGENPIDA